MPNQANKGHTNRDYESELRELRDGLLTMAGRVEQMIEGASRSLFQKDLALAESIVRADGQVNQAELDIDDLCMRILAKRQPMGPDLRFLTRAMKMVTDLERIGDLAVNLAERSMDLARGPQFTVHTGIERIATIVRRMVSDAIDAFVDRDATKAESVIEQDDEVDELYSQIFVDVLEQIMKDPERVHAGIHVQSAAKFIERMGDHATNLAEQVVFMVRGTDIRHEGKLQNEGSDHRT